jgi:two-component system LytT family response regulator
LTDAKRILIVDDEELARQRIRRYLGQTARPFVVGEAATGLEAVEMIASFRPDIVFLDVEMPGLSGFEVLQQFEARPFQVIFETAYDEFAIRAFEEQACDYLLKPFTAARLNQSLARALGRVSDEERLRALEKTIAARDGHLRRLTVKQGNRLRILEEQEIMCFVSRDHYTCVHFSDGREGISELSLARLAERLDPRTFQQLHRNNIVRVTAIVALLASPQGGAFVELANGMRLPISRSKRALAKRLVASMTE